MQAPQDEGGGGAKEADLEARRAAHPCRSQPGCLKGTGAETGGAAAPPPSEHPWPRPALPHPQSHCLLPAARHTLFSKALRAAGHSDDNDDNMKMMEEVMGTGCPHAWCRL